MIVSSSSFENLQKYKILSATHNIRMLTLWVDWKCKGEKCGTGKCGTEMQGWKMQDWKMQEKTVYGKHSVWNTVHCLVLLSPAARTE